MEKQIILFAALLFSVAALAQTNTNKAKAKMVNNIMAADMGLVNSGNIEFTITRSGEKILVTVRATSAAANTWDGKVQGRIIFRDSTEKLFIESGNTQGKLSKRLNLEVTDELTGKTYNLPVDDRHEFGGAVGGPIVKDKVTLKYSLNGQPIARGHSFKFGGQYSN